MMKEARVADGDSFRLIFEGMISEDISKCQAGYSEIVEAKRKKVAFF